MNLIDKVKIAGVVGAGGAGFPAHVKLDCKVECFIANGAECEPLLKTDQYLMREKSMELIQGMETIAKHIGAKQVYLAVKKKYVREIEKLKYAIAELDSKVELFYLDNFFPAGDEQVLVYEVTGKTVSPGGIPLHQGVVVSNVGTIVNVVEAMEGRPVTEKYISVLGEVRNPKLMLVPLGTPVSVCIQEAGGSTIKDYCIIMGGPMMGKLIDMEEVEEIVITKTDGAIILVPKDHYIVNRGRTPITHIINQTKSACIQCRYCTDMCPRFLIGHPLRPHKIMGAIAVHGQDMTVLKEALICCDCGVCELYACPMGLSPRLVNGYLKEKLREKGIVFEYNGKELKAEELREYRSIPTNRLISRLDLARYANQKIDDLAIVSAKKVRIPLKQHIGVASQPLAAVGDYVKKGQLIGAIPDGKLGANIHASIEGKITEVTDMVVIEREYSGVNGND